MTKKTLEIAPAGDLYEFKEELSQAVMKTRLEKFGMKLCAHCSRLNNLERWACKYCGEVLEKKI